MKFIDNLIGKGLSWWLIFQLITLNLAWMVTLAAPMAVLIAVLMAFGSLSSTNEIAVMKAAGISSFKMMIPVIILSGLLCYGLILFNNYVLPEANHRTKILMTDIQRTRPAFVIEDGKFTDDISGYNLLVKRTYEGSNKLEGVFIIDNSNPGRSNVLTAERGEINFSTGYDKIILELYEGQIHYLNKMQKQQDYRLINFDKHIVNIDAQGFGFSSSDKSAFSRGDRELSSDSMRNIISKISSDYINTNQNVLNGIINSVLEFSKVRYDSITSQNSEQAKAKLQSLMQFRYQFINQKVLAHTNKKQIDMYLVEIYKKYSIPFACVVFVMIGIPLGISIRRSGFGVAAGVSLGFFLLYWASLIGGEKLADREILSPLVGMWFANILMGITGLIMILKDNINLQKIKNKVLPGTGQ